MKLLHALYEPAGEGPFPTILAMHGWGSNALDLHGIAPFISDGRFLAICPQGRHNVEIGAINGFGWYETRPGAKPDTEKVDAAVDELRDFINEACGRYPIERSKIVLVGFSQGGMIAYNLAMRWPDKFAALVGISTAFPDFLFERATKRDAIAKLPIMVQHGRADEMLEMSRARKSVELLRELGAAVTFREYDCGHEVCADGVRDLSAFLTEKVADRNRPD
ncbi:MAG TPA: alpha/beta fold hydrolase [Candidatus Binataceae bacterium]|nr:alpha/beta fold hydrolase [Candidatus Binataceae bacterium]